jgi:hypothetical protein
MDEFRRWSRAAAIAFAMAMAVSNGFSQGASQASGTAGVRTAEEAYKNIQVLKGVPADQIPVTMRLIATSLGVQCSFCHVQGANEKDDKPEKQTARRMIQMVLDTNRNHFEGRTAITCQTCHRGGQGPAGTPVPAEMGRPAQRGVVPEGAAAEPLLAKYLQTVGSDAAVAKLTSTVAKGKLESAANPPSPVEMYTKSDKRLVVTHILNEDASEATAGASGWTQSAARGLRDMTAADNEAIKIEDTLYLAANVKKIYSQWRVGRSEKVGEKEAYVLNGTAQGHLPIRLYLDQQTGELLRLMHFTETPVGRLPTQLDYSDYRDVNGVRVPFRIAAIRPQTRNTIQLDQVQHNVAVEDSLFVKPPAPAPR